MQILATLRGMANQPNPDRRVVWSRMNHTTTEAVTWIAKYTSLNNSVVVDAMVCARLGIDHPHGFAISQATTRWKRDHA